MSRALTEKEDRHMWKYYQDLANSMALRNEQTADGREVVIMTTFNKETAQAFIKLAKA